MSTAFMILMFDPSPNAIYLNKFCLDLEQVRQGGDDIRQHIEIFGGLGW